MTQSSSRHRARSLAAARLTALTDTAAEFGEVEVTRPWAETIVAVAVAAGIAHFATGPGTVLTGAAAALLGAVGVNAVRRAEVRDLPIGVEVVLGGLIALATAGVVRLVPTGIGAVIAIAGGIGVLRAVIEWQLRLRRGSNGSLHRDRVVSLAIFTLVLFAASIGIAALVPGIVTLPGTPSARPDPVGPLAILAVGIGSAAVAALLAGGMSALRRERNSAIIRDALGAAALNGAASILFASVGVARLAGPAGLAVLFYAREIWAATPDGERRDPRLLLEILALTLATGVALIWIGVGR
jgi:hypothetical protein